MDPNATWNALLTAHNEQDLPRVEELAGALLDWLDRGGACPTLTGAATDLAVVRGFCAHALETAVEGVTWTFAG
jgi:hypothetical protein